MIIAEFYVLLTMHFGIILINNQFDVQFFFIYVYFHSLHVSSGVARWRSWLRHCATSRKLAGSILYSVIGFFY